MTKAFFALFFALAVASAGCGGGSSGTGNDSANGQMINESCEAVREQDLEALGVPSIEGETDENGNFTISPSGPGSTSVMTETGTATIDSSGASCLFFIIENSSLRSVLSYPITTLGSCSIQSLEAAFPEDFAVICESSMKRSVDFFGS